MRAVLLFDGRLAVTLPVRPLVPAVGRLLTVGLLTLALLVRLEALPAVGRLELLPLTLALLPPALAVPDMLPPVEGLTRPLFILLLIEPAVLLPWRTLAT